LLTPILLDPWLLAFSPETPPEEMQARDSALKKVFDVIIKEYPMEVMPFITSEKHAEYWQELSKYRFLPYAQRVIQWINYLEIEKPDDIQAEPAVLVGERQPDDLSELWRKILSANGNSDAAPVWRFPVVAIPEFRRDEWPDDQEITYRIPNDEGPDKRRNLVNIEDFKLHRYFCSDLDPWLLRSVGEPDPEGAVAERINTCKRLPRPPQICGNLPLGRLADELRKIPSWEWGIDNSQRSFLPRHNWDPCGFNKFVWRNNNLFRTASVPLGKIRGAIGYLDRDDRIWVWHENECHWDVQIDGGKDYEKVCFTGKFLPKDN